MKVAVLDDYQGVALEMGPWERLGDAYEIVPFREPIADEAELVRRLSDFDVVCAMRERTPLPARIIEALPRLKLIVTAGVRNASIDVSAASARGIPVCGTQRSGPAAAELALGLILATARDIVGEANSVRAGGWQVGIGRDLGGATLGLLGLGSLGSRVARAALALDMNVIAWSQNLTAERAAEIGVARVEKDELFARSDVLSIHLVLSERTRGLVGRGELALMKPDAALINTSRGAIVDTEALVEALEGGRLRTAALDVYDTEPLPADDPLRRVPNLLALPHIGYVTRDAYETFYRGFIEAIIAFRDGAPIRVIEPK